MPARTGARGGRNDYGRGAAAKPKGKRGVGAAVQKAGGNGRGGLKKPPAPQRPKPGARKVGKAVATAKPTPVKRAKPGARSVGRTVEKAGRPVVRQARKDQLRSAVESAPYDEQGLERVQGTLSKVLLGRRQSTRVTVPESKRLERERPKVRKQLVESRRRGMNRSNAAALEILDQTLRPARAVGESLKASGGNPTDVAKAPKALKAGAKALVTNKGELPGRVIVGDSKSPAAGAARFALDVVLDPTTYATGGTGSVARRSAEKAASAAAKKAVKAGIGKGAAETAAREAGAAAAKRAARRGATAAAAREAGDSAASAARKTVQAAQVKQVADRAAERTASKAPQGTGLVVKFAGHEVPGVRRATAAASRKSRVKVPHRVKSAVGNVDPNIMPEGVERAAFDAAKGAERQARATKAAGAREAVDRAAYYKRVLGEGDYERVIDAIERGKIKDLPDELAPVAHRMRSEYKGWLRKQRQAGVQIGEIGGRKAKPKPGEARAYFPHMREDLIGKRAPKKKSTTVDAMTNASREDKRRLVLKNADEELGYKFSTDVPKVTANYGMAASRNVADARLESALAGQGRKLTPKARITEGAESVYHVLGGKLRKLDPKDDAAEIKRAVQGGRAKSGPGAGGQYVILNDGLVDRTMKRLQIERTGPGEFFDKAQGKWKSIATATPAYYGRNFAGDAWFNYQATPGFKVPRNAAQSVKALTRFSRREGAKRSKLFPAGKTKQTIKVAGERVNLDDFLNDALDQGVISSGQRGREIQDFIQGTGVSRAGKVRSNPVRRAGRALDRNVLQNTENLFRLATFKDGLDRGLSKEAAAARAMRHHIDYGDVTEFERIVARRVMPFYTFNARAIPMQTKELLKRPGKFANVEKARQEIAYTSGLGDDWEKDLPEWKRRAIPFGTKINGEKVAFDVAPPINMLNELPTSGDAGAYADELMKFTFGLVTPAVKIPVELYQNQSFFFRKPLQNEDYPRVAASGPLIALARKLPKPVRDALGVQRIVDQRTGKIVWGWYGKADYIAKSVPGFPVLLQQLTTEGSLRSGRQGWEKWVSATGLKTDPIDPVSNRIFTLLLRSKKLDNQLSEFNQLPGKDGKPIGRRKDSASPRVQRLLREKARVDAEIFALSAKRGDKNPLKEGSVPKAKRLKVLGKSELQAEFEAFREEAKKDPAAELRREYREYLQSLK